MEPTPIPAVIKSYERWWKGTGWSLSTAQNYRYTLVALRTHLGGTDAALSDASREQIATWLDPRYDRMHAGELAPATLSNDVKAIRSFYRWLHEVEEDITTNPVAKLKGPKVPETVVPVADEVDYRALLKSLGNDLLARRDAAIIALLWQGGFRRSELTVCNVEHVDLDGATLTVPTTKSDKPRQVWLHHDAVRLLDRYLRGRGDAPGPLFKAQRGGRLTSNGIGQMLFVRCEAAGCKITAHSFRRKFAERWVDAGGSYSGLMEHAGWKSEAMVRKYTRMHRQQLAQREAQRVLA